MSIEQSSTGGAGVERCEECTENEAARHVAHAGHDVWLCGDCTGRFWRGEILNDGAAF
ncbi:hypothetical protein ACFO0N_16745 [Halobium salinum]|uniref:Transcription factor zinc-finger domain-containing protein n=1 Tax=Halobium salinum TaxID=1364940 RepID=A0ABD5PFR4_9EURY|nr:hypothetical protein [Halobium salinum]